MTPRQRMVESPPFRPAGVSAPLALAMSLLFYALNVASGLIGGVLYAFEGVRGYVEDRG